MGFDDIIERNPTGTDSLIPEPFVAEVLQEAVQSSAVMQLARTVRMSTKTSRQPVLTALPSAAWLSGDTALKQTTKQTWGNVELVAEELATIVVVPDAYIADSGVPIWNEVRPRLAEAIGLAIDTACLFGVDRPSTFGPDLMQVVNDKGATVAAGTGDDLGVDMLETMRLVRKSGFTVNGVAVAPTFDLDLQGIRTGQGVPIYQPDMTASGPNRIYGYPMASINNGAWDETKAHAIVGDFSKAILGVRQDITFKVSDQAIIQDDSGAIQINTFQQDSVALRVVARYAWAVANPVTTQEADEAARSPFAALVP